MAEIKHILILANSNKKGERCVAGRELTSASSDYYEIGPWIRPIDDQEPEGRILTARTIIDGRQLLPLEIIAMPLTGPAEDPFHPEDWKIDRTQAWHRVEDARPDLLQYIPDDSGDLWGEESAATRKVLPLAGRPTLKLIRPTGKVIVKAYKDDAPWGITYRRQINLEHNGSSHQFSIDDPEFSRRHGITAEAMSKGIHFELDPEKTVVVASLTPPYVKTGYQYKIAATIFEL